MARLVRGLRPRDRALLALLAEHHYLTTEDVATLLFPSVGDTQARLLQLRPPIVKRDRHGTVRKSRNPDGLGLVMRWSRTSASTWHKLSAVYLLRQKGALVLAAMRGEDGAGTQRLVQRSYNAAAFATQLSHDLGAIGFFTGLVRASRSLQDQGLHAWIGEATMRRLYHQEGGELAPDGWGRYIVDGQAIDFQLEWDEGTEPPATITSKAKGYANYYEAKPGDYHVLWVANRAPREDSLREAIARAEPDSAKVIHWTTTAGALGEVGHLGQVWRRLDDNDRIALPAMDSVPTGDEAPADCLGKRGWWERRPVVGEAI